MLLVDKRAGSWELLKPLRKALSVDLVEEASLDFGDVAFEGKGEKGKPLLIGIEFKQLSDIIQCLRDGRFAGHQLPGMRKTYDHSWLLIEGAYGRDDAGFITTHQGSYRGWKRHPGKMRASEFEKHLLTFAMCGGVHVAHRSTRADSVWAIVDLFRWWTDKALDAHTSHVAIHEPVALGVISDFRAAVMAWPGIGFKFSRAVEEEFEGSITEAAAANTGRWADIEHDGRRFGELKAAKLTKFLRGRK